MVQPRRAVCCRSRSVVVRCRRARPRQCQRQAKGAGMQVYRRLGVQCVLPLALPISSSSKAMSGSQNEILNGDGLDPDRIGQRPQQLLRIVPRPVPCRRLVKPFQPPLPHCRPYHGDKAVPRAQMEKGCGLGCFEQLACPMNIVCISVAPYDPLRAEHLVEACSNAINRRAIRKEFPSGYPVHLRRLWAPVTVSRPLPRRLDER